MYIVEEKRELLNKHVEALITELRGLQLDDTNDDIDSNVEYAVLRLLSRLYTKDEATVRTALGTLSNVSLEFFRRVAAPIYVQQAYEVGDPVEFVQPSLAVEATEIKVGGSGGSDE